MYCADETTNLNTVVLKVVTFSSRRIESIYLHSFVAQHKKRMSGKQKNVWHAYTVSVNKPRVYVTCPITMSRGTSVANAAHFSNIRRSWMIGGHADGRESVVGRSSAFAAKSELTERGDSRRAWDKGIVESARHRRRVFCGDVEALLAQKL